MLPKTYFGVRRTTLAIPSGILFLDRINKIYKIFFGPAFPEERLTGNPRGGEVHFLLTARFARHTQTYADISSRPIPVKSATLVPAEIEQDKLGRDKAADRFASLRKQNATFAA